MQRPKQVSLSLSLWSRHQKCCHLTSKFKLWNFETSYSSWILGVNRVADLPWIKIMIRPLMGHLWMWTLFRRSCRLEAWWVAVIISVKIFAFSIMKSQVIMFPTPLDVYRMIRSTALPKLPPATLVHIILIFFLIKSSLPTKPAPTPPTGFFRLLTFYLIKNNKKNNYFGWLYIISSFKNLHT